MKTALTIAGSDSCGGAGIQADIKTMTMNGVYAMSAITALTAQNTQGVFDIMEVSADFLKKELDAVISDIFPDAVKIGMISSSPLIKTIAESIKFYSLKNIVVDPVMIATSGARLICQEAVTTLEKQLFPLATLITPNIPEAECILESSFSAREIPEKKIKITSSKDMEKAGKEIYEIYGSSVLIKGGHSINDASDYLYGKDSKGNIVSRWFSGRRINNPNTHGTGCTLSSAIAANLAKGLSLEEAVENAKSYISMALKAMLNLGHGNGPLMHNFSLF